MSARTVEFVTIISEAPNLQISQSRFSRLLRPLSHLYWSVLLAFRFISKLIISLKKYYLAPTSILADLVFPVDLELSVVPDA